MIDPTAMLVLGVTGLLSALLGSVAGSGGMAILLPVAVIYFGIHQAIPILTIANLSANLSRVYFYRRELELRVVGWLTLGSLPLVVAGTWLFTIAAPELLTRLLGGMLLTLMVWRRLRPTAPRLRRAVLFLPLGMAWGFLAGFMSGVGLLIAPFYLAYGLVKGAYIGTDALGTVFLQSTKLIVFGSANFLQGAVLWYGLALIPFMFAGAWLGKQLLERVPEKIFALLIEVTMLVAGLNFLLRG
ncbi:MAG: sulfite exporter TauE/SafE family protein [SAR324 cluster bacterium]|nr:sulfite exporter TauE/SafE family protein [SAR324 cluster bacterium]MCZ6728833.1 sulfite exporter TauE/SafE family protein [SAR324 cluster bacterium]